MNKVTVLLAVIAFASVGLIFLSIPVAEALSPSSDGSFSVVKKKTGIVIYFCENEAYTFQACNQKYDGYGWTDRINVLVYAPGWNEDSDRIDSIGGSVQPINVYTDVSRLQNLDMQETGPDTGIFMGVIKLTGQMGYVVHDQGGSDGTVVGGMGMNMPGVQMIGMTMVPGVGMQMLVVPVSSHDRMVQIATDTQDGRVTFTWEPNEDTVLTKSAYYTWTVGEAEFEKPVFMVDEPVKFVIKDRDLWKHHAEFHTYPMEVFSDSDTDGILVNVRFTENHDHGEGVFYKDSPESLNEPASHSLTKYTPDGKYKLYFWWEPAGLVGASQPYTFNLMIHDAKTDLHLTDISFDAEILLNGQSIRSEDNIFDTDGQFQLDMTFEQRGSAKVIISNINGVSEGEDFSFQIAPEAEVKEVAPRHHAFSDAARPDKYEGQYGAHFISYLKGEFILTTTQDSHNFDRLRVSPGDQIYVRYHDITLPDPWAEDDGVHIVAAAKVVDSIDEYRVQMVDYVPPTFEVAQPVLGRHLTTSSNTLTTSTHE